MFSSNTAHLESHDMLYTSGLGGIGMVNGLSYSFISNHQDL